MNHHGNEGQEGGFLSSLEPLSTTTHTSWDQFDVSAILDEVSHVVDTSDEVAISPGKLQEQTMKSLVILEPSPIAADGLQLVPSLCISQDKNLLACCWDGKEDLLEHFIAAFSSNEGTCSRKRERPHFDNHRGDSVALSKATTKRRKLGSSSASSTIVCNASSKNQQQQSSDYRFRSYQTEQWSERFQDMLQFKKTFRHCCVPNSFPPNPHLSQW